jgi:hypothetical protein
MNNFKTIGLNHHFGDRFMTVIGIINCILFGGLRPFAGYFFDRFGFKFCINIIVILQIVMEFLIIPSTIN